MCDMCTMYSDISSVMRGDWNVINGWQCSIKAPAVTLQQQQLVRHK